MRKNRKHAINLASFALAAALAASFASAAAAGEYGPVLRSGDPAFRTDLGVQLSLGGSSCVGGGTNYARCNGVADAWDSRFGLQGGLIVRPYRHFSFGLDAGFMSLTSHQVTANTWNDFTVGPTARFHLPIRIRKKVYIEPNIGLQAGYVYGVYRENKDDDSGTTEVGYKHKHYGPFVAVLLGADFFPLPRVGVGLEFRLLRTFYTDVCFESADSVVCRSTQDERLVNSDVREPGGQTAQYLRDKGVAEYPWKLFWGVHGLYYF
jgi:hypothetical protein